MCVALETANSKGNSRQLFQIVKSYMNRKSQPRLQCIQSATGKKLTEAAQVADGWKRYCEDLYYDKEGKELNENIGSKSLHYFVQRLLLPSIRQQVAKPQVLMRSQQNCSKSRSQSQSQSRRSCFDLIMCYKIIFGLVCVNADDFLSFV